MEHNLYLSNLKDFICEYCRIDIDFYTDVDIDIYMYASAEYIKNATGISIEDEPDNFLYKLAVAMLTCHFYENRSIVTVENNSSLKQSLTYILLQLKNCYGG